MAVQAQDMTWSDYVAMLRRRWRPTVIAGATVALIAIYITYSLPAVYESSASILIEQQGIPSEYVQTTVNVYAEELLQNIHQRVTASPVVLDLIQKLDLYPEVRATLPEEDLVQMFRESTDMESKSVPTIHSRTGRESVVTFGFDVRFRDADPVKARDVVDALSQLYVAQNSALRAETAARTTAFLDTEAVQLQEKLHEVAQRIADFKEQHPNNLPEHQQGNLSSWERAREDLIRVEAELRDARERKAIHESDLAETPRYRPVLDDSGEPVLGGVDRLAEAQQELMRLRGRYSENHPAVVNLRREIEALSSAPVNQANLAQQLRADLAARREELAAARETYSSSHPDVIALERTVRSLEAQLAEAADAVAASGPVGPQPNNPVYVQLMTRISTVNAEIADLSVQRDELRTRLSELDALRSEAPTVEREYGVLTHEQDLLLVQYRELRSLEGEALLASNLESGDSGERLSIVEPPRVPANPASPNRPSLLLLGIVLATAIALGVASLTENFDTKVRSQRDIKMLLEMPPMAVIPFVETPNDTFRRLAVNIGIASVLVGATAFVVATAVV